MYMKQYTVAELRTKLREALNEAEAGEPVVITRHGVDFVLIQRARINTLKWDSKNKFVPIDEVGFIKPEDFKHIGIDPAKVNGDISIEHTPAPEPLDARGVEVESGKPTVGKIKSVATPPNEIESKLQSFAADKGMRFCGNGHAIPAGRSKCMGKGCKYA
jgi:prevent-host-death family protein